MASTTVSETKVDPDAESPPVRPPSRKLALTKAQIIIILIGFFLLLCFGPAPWNKQSFPLDNWWGNDEDGRIPMYIWEDDVVGTVRWRKCSNIADAPGAECGYIVVPKDYFDANAGTAKIALGRLKAVNSSLRKGSVLFNPGGPGGSGKQAITRIGVELRTAIGDDYDIVGFDPRGIGESEPKTQCFQQWEYSHTNYIQNTILERSYEFPSNASYEDVRDSLIAQQREADALLKTQFEVCREIMGEELKYMGTSTVVRDIDFIVKHLDGEDALINFYGGSYGSILGQYLVNMLPDRVGRVVIDGIADAVAWSNKPYYQWYSQWLSSTEDAYDIFVTECSKAGPERCPLANSQGENPSVIKQRIEDFIDSLYYQPLAVPGAKKPVILTSGRIRKYILQAIQRPMTWPDFAHSLNQAIRGDGSLLLNAFQPNFYKDLERSAVSCNDAAPFSPPGPEEVIEEIWSVFKNVSTFAFSIVTDEPDAGCQYWPVTPPERFAGPWNHTLRNPMLVISNTADPVTPITSGKMVQKLLGDSARLLVLDSPGHGSFALPSLCVAHHKRAYFSNGTLPPEGTVCAVDASPFPDEQQQLLHSQLSNEEQRHLRNLELLESATYYARMGRPSWWFEGGEMV